MAYKSSSVLTGMLKIIYASTLQKEGLMSIKSANEEIARYRIHVWYSLSSIAEIYDLIELSDYSISPEGIWIHHAVNNSSTYFIPIHVCNKIAIEPLFEDKVEDSDDTAENDLPLKDEVDEVLATINGLECGRGYSGEYYTLSFTTENEDDVPFVVRYLRARGIRAIRDSIHTRFVNIPIRK